MQHPLYYVRCCLILYTISYYLYEYLLTVWRRQKEEEVWEVLSPGWVPSDCLEEGRRRHARHYLLDEYLLTVSRRQKEEEVWEVLHPGWVPPDCVEKAEGRGVRGTTSWMSTSWLCVGGEVWEELPPGWVPPDCVEKAEGGGGVRGTTYWMSTSWLCGEGRRKRCERYHLLDEYLLTVCRRGRYERYYLLDEYLLTVWRRQKEEEVWEVLHPGWVPPDCGGEGEKEVWELEEHYLLMLVADHVKVKKRVEMFKKKQGAYRKDEGRW